MTKATFSGSEFDLDTGHAKEAAHFNLHSGRPARPSMTIQDTGGQIRCLKHLFTPTQRKLISILRV
jgi:hypothetical protein